MPEPGCGAAAPNVVSPEAAERIRFAVLGLRDRPVIDPLDVVAKLIEEGHGSQFGERIRSARVHTWVKQVFRRLRKYGWLATGKRARWIPTAALTACRDALELTGKAPTDLRHVPERPAPVATPEPKRGSEVVELPPEPAKAKPPRSASRPTRKPRKAKGELSVSTTDLIRTFEAEKSTVREKLARLKDRDAFLEKVIAELRGASGGGEAKKTMRLSRSGKTETPAASPRKKRKKPVKADISASEAVLRLLAGSKIGLPAAEIISYVHDTHGYRTNSLRTTLYNLKKAGKVVQGKNGIYNHPTNLA